MSTMTKDIICITCPQGCIIKVTGDPKAGTIESCEGFQCKRGKVYAENEFVRPLRILTSSVKVEGGDVPLVAVRTAAPIPKELQMQGMEEIKKITVKGKHAPGDVIVEDFLGTGVALVFSGALN